MSDELLTRAAGFLAALVVEHVPIPEIWALLGATEDGELADLIGELLGLALQEEM